MAMILLVVCLWVFIYGIPDFILHHVQWGSVAGQRDSHRVALTFDDGPGPDTQVVLDMLKMQETTATFFVVAERAAANPEIIRAMKAAGHEIGLHSDRHVSSYLEWPWTTWRRMKRGTAILTQITSERPRYYRPPWGHFNMVTWLAGRFFGLERVLWTVAPNDWQPTKTAADISQHVVQFSQPGTIIVLHDAGGPRTRTAEALGLMIPQLKALNLQPGPVGEMPVDRSEFRRAWTWWEIRFTRSWDVDTVPSSRGGDPILRLGVIQYQGNPCQMLSGDVLSPGDKMGEIHFGNPALSQMSKNATGGLRAFHAVLRGMTDIAQYIASHEKYQDIRAVGGITLLDASGAIDKLGFQRLPVTGWQKWSMWIYLTFLMAIYHQAGWQTLRRFFRLHPVLLLMSKDTLLKRYGKDPNKRQA